MSHGIDSAGLLDEYLAEAVPDGQRRDGVLGTLLRDAEHEVLWCWGDAG